VLEFLWWSVESGTPEPSVISVQALKAACGVLDEYFLPMAERVYGDAAIPARERHAMVLIRHLRKAGVRRFNARKLRREVGGSLRDPGAMEAACKTLIEAGLIRPRFSRAGQQAGRPSRDYEVNAVVHEGAGEQVG